ncbi:MAG: hypothetical protein ACM3IJ_01775 [Candidatus Levyibacteriota bacterium]
MSKEFSHSRISRTVRTVGAGTLIMGAISGVDCSGSQNGSSKTTLSTVTPGFSTPTLANGSRVALGETPTAKPTEAPTATPTPEKPKTVAWTLDQITAAQQEGLRNNKVLFLDTWSQEGGVMIDAKNFKGQPTTIIDYKTSPEGKSFNSPIAGTVTGVAVTPFSDGTKIRSVFITQGNIETQISFDFDAKVSVENGQKISDGTLLATLGSNRLSKSGLLSKPGYIMISDTTNFTSTTENIIKDANGTTVTLAR